MNTTPNPITTAISKAGTASALARGLGITPQAIRKYQLRWDNGDVRAIPAHRAIEIERAFGVPRHVLRPDLWSAPPDLDTNQAKRPAGGGAANNTGSSGPALPSAPAGVRESGDATTEPGGASRRAA